MKRYIILLFVIFSLTTNYAQLVVQGKVTITKNGKEVPIMGADIFWQGTTIGVTSDENGHFSIVYNHKFEKLIISYLGFNSETILINNPTKYLTINLTPKDNELKAVEVEIKRNSTQKLQSKIANVININSNELLKASCCNLSNSFETNTTVDVSISDALTGTKQIKMLGLSSPYLLMTQENIPSIRGASQIFGMTFIPGTWIESIQIIKGSGSVINGYESITGQVNTELVKPISDKPFFINIFGSADGRVELNTHINQKISDKWHTGLYLHGDYRKINSDMNNDNFLDMPNGQQFNIMNRWQYSNLKTGWRSNIILHYLTDERTAGQKDFDISQYSPTYNIWGSNIKIHQFNTMTKLGYIWKDMPYQSIGLQADYKYYQQKSFFGRNQYDINQHSGFLNLIFSSIINNTNNKFTTGITTNYDKYKEFTSLKNSPKDYDRSDYGIGTFFEYSYDNIDNFSITTGIRMDVNNQLGFFVTPRLHIRYTPWEKGTFRISAGRGKRIANIFAENQNIFSTSRNINLSKLDNKRNFGLETAWNYGVSFSQNFELNKHKGDISIDFYHTHFQNRIVVDWENPRQVSFYNLEGISYANSLQLELNYEPMKNLHLRGAYKFYDVKTDYISGEKEQPLQAKHRFFTNLAYETSLNNNHQWRFDYTFSFIGRQRLPSTKINPTIYQLGEYTDTYHLSNVQITRVFSKQFEVYMGIENLFNYQQKNAIIASNEPFSSYFDASIVYAPIFGRMIYAGLRYNINKK